MIERLYQIAGFLRSGQRFTLSILSKKFEVSLKTAQRDIDFLRDRLLWPMEYDRPRKTWILTGMPPEPKL